MIPGSHLLMGEERLAFASTVSSLPLTEVPATACTTEPGDVIGARAYPCGLMADGCWVRGLSLLRWADGGLWAAFNIRTWHASIGGGESSRPLCPKPASRPAASRSVL